MCYCYDGLGTKRTELNIIYSLETNAWWNPTKNWNMYHKRSNHCIKLNTSFIILRLWEINLIFNSKCELTYKKIVTNEFLVFWQVLGCIWNRLTKIIFNLDFAFAAASLRGKKRNLILCIQFVVVAMLNLRTSFLSFFHFSWQSINVYATTYIN